MRPTSQRTGEAQCGETASPPEPRLGPRYGFTFYLQKYIPGACVSAGERRRVFEEAEAQVRVVKWVS